MRNLLLLLTFINYSCMAQNNWNASNIGLPANAYVNAFAQVSSGDIYVAINSNGQGQLLKSTDNGSSWSIITTAGLPTGGWAGSLFVKGGTMFLGSESLGSFLYTSNDNGQNWSASNNGLPANAYVNEFAQSSNGDIYIVVNSNGQGQLLKSTDNGSSWSIVTTNGLPSGAWAASLFIKGNLMFIGTGALGSFLYSSNDNGQNWSASNSGIPANAYVNDFAQASNGDIYTIVNSNGEGQLLKSSNSGSSWSLVTITGLPTGGWGDALFVKGNSMFIGSGALGSFLYVSTTATDISDIDFSSSIVLFPNPNNGQISITATDKIDLIEISNSSGKIVYGQKLNSSQASFSLDNAGVYFVTTTAEGHTTTKKLLVVQR